MFVRYFQRTFVHFIEPFEVPVSLMYLVGATGLVCFAGIISIAFRIIDSRSRSEIENGIFTDNRYFSVQTGNELIGYSFIISTYHEIVVISKRNGQFIISIL